MKRLYTLIEEEKKWKNKNHTFTLVANEAVPKDMILICSSHGDQVFEHGVRFVLGKNIGNKDG